MGLAGWPVPRALICHFAIELFPRGDELLAVVEREDGAWDDGNVRAADDFEHAQRVGNFLVTPLVASDDGDAKDFGVGRLNQGEDGLLVGGGGATRVLINDDFASLLRASGRCKNCSEDEQKQKTRATHRGTPLFLSGRLGCGAYSTLRISSAAKNTTRASAGG